MQHSIINLTVLYFYDALKYIRKNCIKEGHPELSKISQGTISKILNESKIKPHKIRSYTAKVDPDFDKKAAKVLGTYKEAKKLKKLKKKT